MNNSSFKRLAKHYRGASDSDSVAMSLVKRNPELAAAVSKAETSRFGYGYDGSGKGGVESNIQPHLMRGPLTKKANAIIDAKSVFRLLPDQEMAAQILTSVITSPKDMVSVDPIYETTKQVFDQSTTAQCLSLVKEHMESEYGLKRKLPVMIRKALIDEGAYVEAVLPENAVDMFINGVATESSDGKVTNLRLGKPLGILGDWVAKVDSKQPTYSKTSAIFESFYKPSTTDASSYVHENLHYHDETLVNGSPWQNPLREEYVTITDNPAILKLPDYIKSKLDERVRSVFEDIGNTPKGNVFVGQSDDKIASSVYNGNRAHTVNHVARIPGQDEVKRKSVGEPLIMRIPAEAVWTVYTPGDKSEHLGIYVLLDNEGRPISAEDTEKSISLSNSVDGAGTGSSLIRRVDMNLSGSGGGNGFDTTNIEHQLLAMKLFADAVDRDLIKRVQAGSGVNNVALSRNDSIYMLMLNRVLSKRYTQILYIPIQYATYFAFDYGQNGIGKSLMENGAQINVFRICLMFSDVVGAMKNAMGRTKMSINIPENDPNPLQTIETVVDQYVRSKAINFSTSVSEPADIMTMVQKSGLEIDATGNKRLPDLKVEFEQRQSGYQKADTDLTEHLSKLSSANMSLPPEMIDASQNSPEYATSIVSNNLLLTQRVLTYHSVWCPQMTSHMKKLVRASGNLKTKLLEVISKPDCKINKELVKVSNLGLSPENEKLYEVKQAFELFVEVLKFTLPSPVIANIEAQSNEIQTQSEAFDKALDTVMSEEMFTPDMVGKFSGGTKSLRAHIKASLMRSFLSSRGLFPEVVSLFSAPDKEKAKATVFDDVVSFINEFQKYGIASLARIQPMIHASDADMKKNKIKVGDDAGSSGDDYGGGDGASISEDDGGGNPFGDPSGGGEEDPPTGEENKAPENPF